ncbi:hypothetical protein DSO57_1024663 [Entomophthora muscae]|uniref:Uncharacterized protein n=1 Tax=Entomophthora muscae TaxID=34485 RepID=A0ACC2UMW8_9FUNG|nr:hypothetical protein DSO57_1024663 [Entomophthora muscae]
MIALITGASGLLGRAVHKCFNDSGKFDAVVGISYSRTKGDLRKVDLCDKEALSSLLDEVKPQVIIHCAAERRPDVAEKDTAGTLKLNVEVSENLASEALKHDSRLIYISTDYVFDGTSPPYHVNDQPNPLNFYGKSKLQGEIAVHQTNPGAIVLRVPVLYGEVEFPGESAVNILIENVNDTSKNYNMDHHSSRYPTHVKDVALVCLELAECSAKKIPPILHYSAPERLTKYDMCCIFSNITGKNIDHIKPDSVAPPFNPSGTTRPEDCELSIDALTSLGVGTFPPTSLKEWFEKYLK